MRLRTRIKPKRGLWQRFNIDRGLGELKVWSVAWTRGLLWHRWQSRESSRSIEISWSGELLDLKGNLLPRLGLSDYRPTLGVPYANHSRRRSDPGRLHRNARIRGRKRFSEINWWVVVRKGHSHHQNWVIPGERHLQFHRQYERTRARDGRPVSRFGGYPTGGLSQHKGKRRSVQWNLHRSL